RRCSFASLAIVFALPSPEPSSVLIVAVGSAGQQWNICTIEFHTFVRLTMLMELTVVPLGRGRSLSADLAELIGRIDQSGLPYRVTPFGTLLEGTWDQLMDVAKECHSAIRKKTDRVLILIRL